MRNRIEHESGLRGVYPEPVDLIRRKELSRLDVHCRRFIALSPIVFLATSGADGTCDVSPRGDAPGFVAVLGDRRLAIPDRKGNNRLDSMSNILANPHVGLLFVIPGIWDTLRVNGPAAITADGNVLSEMAVDGKTPSAAILVEVDEAYLHCGRAFKRGRVWDSQRFTSPKEMPTLGAMLSDQVNPDSAEQALLIDSEEEDLY